MKGKRVCRKKRAGQFLTVVLCIALTLFSTACGNKDVKPAPTESETGHDGTEPLEEFIYVPEHLMLDSENEDSSYGYFTMKGDSLYYIEFCWNTDANKMDNLLHRYSMENGSIDTIPLELEEGENLTACCLTTDMKGNLYLLVNAKLYTNQIGDNIQSQVFLRKMDSQGTVLMEQEITDIFRHDGVTFFPEKMAVDENENIYIITAEGCYLLDASAAMTGMIQISGGQYDVVHIDAIAHGGDGEMYIVYGDYSSPDGGKVLAEIDFAEKKVVSIYANLPAGNTNTFLAGAEWDFLLSDGLSVYGYDMVTQSCTKLWNWVDSDINGANVNYMTVLEDGRILVISTDLNSGIADVMVMTKTKSSELVQKEEIVCGILYQNQELQAAAVAFNKQNSKYHISIRTYMDYRESMESGSEDAFARLNNDVLSEENCPDILDLTQINESAMVSKGVFEDLYPYLEKSSVLSTDAFVEHILEQFTYDGKLFSIPRNFSFDTVVGRSSVVGERMGWSVEEMMGCVKEHPNSQLFNNMSKSEMMHFCMLFNQDSFVDWEKAECYFDTEEFKNILAFTNLFPDEIDWQRYDANENVANLQSGKTLLEKVHVSQVQDIQIYPALFGEKVTFIGYPVVDDGVGITINSASRYGITSKSKHKEGAWEFIESYLTMESSNAIPTGFSTLKKRFERQLEDAMKVEYALDENGEIVLDENGEPVMKKGTSSVRFGEWEYTFSASPPEDVVLVEKLLSVARSSANVEYEVLKIIQEEAELYYKGQKTVDEVAEVIQNRVQMYVSENK